MARSKKRTRDAALETPSSAQEHLTLPQRPTLHASKSKRVKTPTASITRSPSSLPSHPSKRPRIARQTATSSPTQPANLIPPHGIIEFSPHPTSEPGSLLRDLHPFITNTRAFSHELHISLQLLPSLGPIGVLEYWKHLLSSLKVESQGAPPSGNNILVARRRVLDIVQSYLELHEQGLGSSLDVQSERVRLLKDTLGELSRETRGKSVVYVSDDVTARTLADVLSLEGLSPSSRVANSLPKVIAIRPDEMLSNASGRRTGQERLENHTEAGIYIVPAIIHGRLSLPRGCNIIHFDEFDGVTRAMLQPRQGDDYGSYLAFIDRNRLSQCQDFIQGNSSTGDVKDKGKARDVGENSARPAETATTAVKQEPAKESGPVRQKAIDPMALASSWTLDLQKDADTTYNGVGTYATRSIRFLRQPGKVRCKLEVVSTGRVITLPYAKTKVQAYFLSLNEPFPALQLTALGSEIYSCKIEMPSRCQVSGIDWKEKAGPKKAIIGLAYITICLKLYLAGEISDDLIDEPAGNVKLSKKRKRNDDDDDDAVEDAVDADREDAIISSSHGRQLQEIIPPPAVEAAARMNTATGVPRGLAEEQAVKTLPTTINLPQPPSIAVAGYGDKHPVSVAEAGTLLPPTRSRHPQKFPDFWWSCLPTKAGTFAVTVVQIQRRGASTLGVSSYRPFCILTSRRLPLPQVHEFPIYENGCQLWVHFKTASSMQLTPEELQAAHIFTLRLERMVLNHALIQNVADCPYLFVPLKTDAVVMTDSTDIPDVRSQISWQEIYSQRETPLSTPFDLADLDTLREQCKDAFSDELVTILKHTNSGSKNWNPQQPVFEVELVPTCENMLQARSNNLTAGKDGKVYRYLVPEGVRRHGFGCSMLKSASAIPSIITRLESFLLVKEVKGLFFDSDVDELDILAALTPPGRREERDYDRLEFFGDSILKFIATAYIYTASPEEISTLRRSEINDNAELRLAMVKSKAVDYIQPLKFIVKKWRPLNTAGYRGSGMPSPPALLPNAFSRDRYRVHELAFKTPADVAEALIAVATFSGGIAAGFRICKRLGLNLPGIEFWRDLAEIAARPESSLCSLPDHVQTQLEKTINYTFIDKNLASFAMTDPNALGPALSSQTKLVFLGDSLLDYLAADSLYVKDEDDLRPGELNRWKAGMTNNQAIAALAVQFGLHELVQYSSDVGRSRKEVVRYKNALAETRQSQPSNKQPWREVYPPKFLHDVVKALFAVALIDSGWSMDGPKEMFRTMFESFATKHMDSVEDVEQHPRQLLMDLLESKGCNGLKNLTIETNPITDTWGRGGPTLRTLVTWHGSLLASAEGPKSRITVRDACRMAMVALLQIEEDHSSGCSENLCSV